jgi:hypothetical protein
MVSLFQIRSSHCPSSSASILHPGAYQFDNKPESIIIIPENPNQLVKPDTKTIIQDEYRIPMNPDLTFVIKAKWELVKKYLPIASANIDPTTWYFNLASVTPGLQNYDSLFPPLEMATEHFDENYLLVQGVNYWLSTYPFVTTGRYGTVMMDFPELHNPYLIGVLIETNKCREK